MSRTCERGWSLFSCRSCSLYSVKSTLVQVRHIYACGEGCVTKFFMSKCSQGNFIDWDKVSCKTIKGFQSYLKNPPGGKVYTSPPQKKAVFMHFKFLFMHSWMLYAPHLVPDIEHFSRINHIIFNWEQKFGNKFSRDCLK